MNLHLGAKMIKRIIMRIKHDNVNLVGSFSTKIHNIAWYEF